MNFRATYCMLKITSKVLDSERGASLHKDIQKLDADVTIRVTKNCRHTAGNAIHLKEQVQ